MPVKCACAPAECGGGNGAPPPLPPHEGATEMVPVLEAAVAVLAKNEYISNPVAVAVAAAAAAAVMLLLLLPFETPPIVLRSADETKTLQHV